MKKIFISLLTILLFATVSNAQFCYVNSPVQNQLPASGVLQLGVTYQVIVEIRSLSGGANPMILSVTPTCSGSNCNKITAVEVSGAAERAAGFAIFTFTQHTSNNPGSPGTVQLGATMQMVPGQCSAGTSVISWIGDVYTLPIELADFSGIAHKNGVSLNWVTASESNSASFNIERSYDGKSFKQIGTVEGAGNSLTESSYSFEDISALKSAKSNTTYYRLKHIDFNGDFTYSNVISTTLDGQKRLSINNINTYGSDIDIFFESVQDGRIDANIFGLNGNLIASRSFEGNEGFNQVNIPLNVPHGMYIIQISNGAEIATQKIVK